MNETKYSRVRKLRDKLREAKKDYLLDLIALGYGFEQKYSHDDTQYWAIRSDPYTTFEERWDKEAQGKLVWDGTIFPKNVPKRCVH